MEGSKKSAKSPSQKAASKAQPKIVTVSTETAAVSERDSGKLMTYKRKQKETHGEEESMIGSKKTITTQRKKASKSQQQSQEGGDEEEISLRPSKRSKTDAVSTDVASSRTDKGKAAVLGSTIKAKPKVPEFTVKCRTKTLVEIIKGLTDEQKTAVREIGFGGILELKVTELVKGTLKWIVDAYDDRTCMVHITRAKEFVLTKHDIHDFLLLPREGREPELVAKGRTKGSSENPIKDRWRVMFGIGGTTKCINNADVAERLKQEKSAGDDFKRMFAIYCLGAFLAPTSNYVIDFTLLGAVEDVSRINTIDWCSYVLQKLNKAVADYKRGGKSICGCILLLLLAYNHRLEFKGEIQPSELPLIQHWTDQKLKQRVDDEKNAGSLGHGPLTKTNYPICIHGQAPKTEGPKREQDQLQMGGRAEAGAGEEFVVMRLFDGIETDEKLQEKAIDESHLLFLEMKRDSDLFHARNVKRMDRFKNMIAANAPSGEGSSSTAVPLTPTQRLLQNPAYLAYIDDLVRISKTAKDVKFPSFDEILELLKAFNDDCEMEEREAAANKEKAATKEATPIVATDDSQSQEAIHLDDIVSSIYIQAGIPRTPRPTATTTTTTKKATTPRRKATTTATKKKTTQETTSEAEVPQTTATTTTTTAKRKRTTRTTTTATKKTTPATTEELQSFEDAMDKGLSSDTVLFETAEQDPGNSNEKVAEKTTVLESTEEDEGEDVDGKEGEKDGQKEEEKEEDEKKEDDKGEKVKEKSDEQREDITDEEAIPETFGTEERLVDRNPYLLHGNRIEECMDAVCQDFGCTDECGGQEDDKLLVSKYMIEKSDLMKVVLKKRKELLDYCFLDDYECDAAERLGSFDYLIFIDKEDALSMMADVLIATPVIDSWSYLLNAMMDGDMLAQQPSRSFFGTNHNGAIAELIAAVAVGGEAAGPMINNAFQSWIQWSASCKNPVKLDADLIFIPCLVEEHFFCVCINFLTRQVEYLDNRRYAIDEGTFDDLETVHYGRITAEVFGQYLTEQGLERGNDVAGFKMVNVEFRWQSEARDDVDCGCFLMFHMLFYRGVVFHCDLWDRESRILYRAELLAILLMSPYNESKQDLLQKLEKFNNEKEALLPEILQARRLKAEEEEREKKKPKKGTKKKPAKGKKPSSKGVGKKKTEAQG